MYKGVLSDKTVVAVKEFGGMSRGDSGSTTPTKERGSQPASPVLKGKDRMKGSGERSGGSSTSPSPSSSSSTSSSSVTSQEISSERFGNPMSPQTQSRGGLVERKGTLTERGERIRGIERVDRGEKSARTFSPSKRYTLNTGQGATRPSTEEGVGPGAGASGESSRLRGSVPEEGSEARKSPTTRSPVRHRSTELSGSTQGKVPGRYSSPVFSSNPLSSDLSGQPSPSTTSAPPSAFRSANFSPVASLNNRRPSRSRSPSPIRCRRNSNTSPLDRERLTTPTSGGRDRDRSIVSVLTYLTGNTTHENKLVPPPTVSAGTSASSSPTPSPSSSSPTHLHPSQSSAMTAAPNAAQCGGKKMTASADVFSAKLGNGQSNLSVSAGENGEGNGKRTQQQQPVEKEVHSERLPSPSPRNTSPKKPSVFKRMSWGASATTSLVSGIISPRPTRKHGAEVRERVHRKGKE